MKKHHFHLSFSITHKKCLFQYTTFDTFFKKSANFVIFGEMVGQFSGQDCPFFLLKSIKFNIFSLEYNIMQFPKIFSKPLT